MAIVLLTSLLRVSRMAYAMARRKDVPEVLSRLHPRHGTPYYPIWTGGALMMILVLRIDLSRVVAISTSVLLFYYSLANVSARRLKPEKRLYPRLLPALGGVTCLALLMFIVLASPEAWMIGTAGLAAGAVYDLFKINLMGKKTN